MTKKNKKYLVEREYKTEIEFSEIDFDLRKELGLKEDDIRVGIIDSNDSFCWSGESHPINIDRMIKALNELKNKHKCKYVEIMYHCDHIGYNLTGLNINVCNQDTKKYKDYIAENNKRTMDKLKRIKELEEEIEDLKSDL